MQHLYLAVNIVEIHGPLGVEGGDVRDEPVGPKAQHQALHNLRVILTRAFEQTTPHAH